MGSNLFYKDLAGIMFKGIEEIRGSLLVLKPIPGIGFDEVVLVRAPDGRDRVGRVLEVGEDAIIVQVFGEEMGLQVDSVVKFTGSTFEVVVAKDTGDPVIGATVTFNDKTYTTGAGGVATLTAPTTAGEYTITASFGTFTDATGTVTVKAGGTPGFEVLTLLVAIGVAFILLRRRRR